MNSDHRIDGPINLDDEPARETIPAPAVELPRPTPIDEIPKWALKKVARRSESPLPEDLLI
jgi:hypothetical protein